MKTHSSPSNVRERIHRLREQPKNWIPRIVAEMSAETLQKNYSAIQDLVPGQSILPMVKADGYGHGAEWVARTLAGFPALYGMGVATLEEGAAIRDGLGPRYRKIKILVFSGSTHWSDEKGEFCESYNLTPVIASDADWALFFRGGWAERISYEIKFNTGMNRLGMSPSMTRALIRDLAQKPSTWHPDGILSHLAMGESPEAKLSQSQRECFVAIRGELESVFPSAHFHLANSAAIWRQKDWRLDGLTDVVRPGLSLYGVLPWRGAPERGIHPVMTLKAPVIQVRTLKQGESLGYGGTFKASSNSTQVAILAAGYADGLPRALGASGKGDGGHVWLSGRSAPFIGRVSMDLSAVQCSAQTRVGDWAEIIGAHLDPWEQAQAADTIPYELLTSVSPRVQRVYD